ncbi:nitroreductase family deazaflavin-dependent oxidoreductase [Mycobacterium sp.]|uniref:nitroreductase family deazaflavin-dependent oxidoreductase n=1 Tax=Mycobacterium sp. TaxID=1785 RepID=UPI003A892D79
MTSRNRLNRLGARALRSRRLVRAPIWIFKARAGAVFGPRFLMLEHIGRKSGEPRYVVLEVIDRPAPDVYIIASGFGRKAQWFRNIEANPRVRVYTGSRAPAPAIARVLTQHEADAAIAGYRDRHPGAWESLKGILEDTLGAAITDTNTPLPMVELKLDRNA